MFPAPKTQGSTKNISEDLNLLAPLEVVDFDDFGRSRPPRLKKDHTFIEPLA